MTELAVQWVRFRGLRRPGAMVERNFTAHRRAWLLIVSGVFEPLFYLLGLGIGVGALVGKIPLPDGRHVDYATFVAPAMLANAAMMAAIAETSFNVFGKLKWAKLYDGILATPLRPMEIMMGETAWALLRGALYVVAFLVVMASMGMIASAWAILALPAAVLIGLSFVGIGLTMSTLFRSWTDFDWLMSMVFVMFLFSGTFTPIENYPVALQWLVYLSPLYHGIELVRGLTLGLPQWGLLGHAAYLVLIGAIGITVASRRMGKLLYK
ncbi:MAG TPA: ABC transporter permease [Stackebrandtia sp.]|jgi:lipooligosaccharide transport system permease protein|uniref:ABC transporter permease n=1 Tax=Stackebrandtia sp. TaxID=2023065 RepID=UPI002D63442B|nr:ABC transporter permease [Stackebrandtia sp.]HZE38198.1 ABC transporter permease [Stackebrandtia sp.]